MIVRPGLRNLLPKRRFTFPWEDKPVLPIKEVIAIDTGAFSLFPVGHQGVLSSPRRLWAPFVVATSAGSSRRKTRPPSFNCALRQANSCALGGTNGSIAFGGRCQWVHIAAATAGEKRE